MKKLLIILISIPSLILAEAKEKPKVVSSASMIYDMVNQIAGDKIDHELIVPIGGDPHLHEPTPRDARIVAAADQIFINGLTFEGWILELIDNSGTKATIDTVTKGIKAIQSSTYKESFDPHAWMNVQNGIKYVNNIKAALIKLDPENSEFYIKNYKNYIAKLYDLDNYILKQIATIPDSQRILITSHDAFKYYGKRYGLKLEAIVGISTEAEAQTSDIIRITNAIKKYNVPAIFIESTINPKLMEQIAADNNVAIGGKLYADSIGDKDSPAPTYHDMLKHNTDVIVEALTQTSRNISASENKNSSLKYLIVIGLIAVAGLLFIIFKVSK